MEFASVRSVFTHNQLISSLHVLEFGQLKPSCSAVEINQCLADLNTNHVAVLLLWYLNAGQSLQYGRGGWSTVWRGGGRFGV